ncbi:MAG TPA: hypothetical protein VGK89_13785 [Candidatus Eisenbacteria bacterium]|jgi:hypothetical protein
MPGTAPSARPSPAPAPLSHAPLVLVVTSAGLVFAGALAYFFSQDDFAALARARGIIPPVPGVWRWVSGPVYFALMRPWGLAATAYHAVNLLAHCACAGLLFTLLRRRFAAPAAFLGALFFATHPALYTAVYWVAALNEILALLFALLCIAWAARPGRAAWLAVPLFGLSLLSKETTLLLPAALWIAPGWLDPGHSPATPEDGGDRRRRDVRIALSVLALVYLALWLWSDAFGARSGLPAAAPYAVGIGRHAVVNFITYLGWTAGTLLPVTRKFDDAAEPGLWPWAAALAAIWIAGLFSARLRRSGWLAGGATFVALIAPVLGLRNHTYHYYLYSPLIGVAWCAGALADAAFLAPAPARAGATAGANAPRLRALAWPAALFAGALLLLNGALMVRKIESMPFVNPRLRAEPVVDRALIARRVHDGLAAADLPPGARLLFWSPSSMIYERSLHPDADVIHAETYWERNVRSALMEGLAVRVMFPQVDSVTFLHAYTPAPADARFVLYDPDGTVTVATPAHVDSMLRQATAR